MPLDKKIGQMFMIGIEGKTMTEETERIIKELHPGSVLLLSKNIGTEDELKKLAEDLQKIAIEDTGLPLFIAVDQEGGEVSRIKWVESTSQQEIETGEDAYKIGKKRSEELKSLGINLNLAPLLDILSPGDFIYQRGFSKDHALLGNNILKGQGEGGTLSCIKHFPGYGGIPFHPEDNLASVENLPEYSHFSEIENFDMVMISNVIYRELGEMPFSFSKEGIGILKNTIKGEYIIMTDDLSQYSLLNNYSLDEIIKKPIEAGSDILIFSGWRISVGKGVKKALELLESGEIKEERIEESFLKIKKLKENYF
ncbi:MAG: hypothetical protein A2562_04640 [Candidatus Nealsonbacteria bacterium RIFOXYD1_FULL_39_11]|nr:MAG: hypothetical protein A2562_04640 [Candidatus Nealsonbacteria bacterium RIFOXYD1_FULL_39_11]